MWVVLALICSCYTDETLISVYAICRHGDRYPQIQIPGFPGEGEPELLTSLGMTQHVKVGQFIKAHYGGENAFLSEKFYPKENYIRVSNYDRCFLSAVSQFSGIYPETNESSRSLVSYPMYSELRNDEYLLRGFDVCNISLDHYKQFKQTPKYKELLDSIQTTMEWLSNTYHYTVNESNYEKVADALYIKSVHDETHYSDDDKKAFKKLSDVMDQTRPEYFNRNSTAWVRASAGLLLYEMFVLNPKIDQTMDPNQGYRKYRLYSAHDSTLFSFVHTLGHPTISLPYYAAITFVELWKQDDGKLFLKFYYQTEEQKARDGELWEPYTPEGCGDTGTCYLEEFQKHWDDRMVKFQESSPFDPKYTDPTKIVKTPYNTNTNPLKDYIISDCKPKTPSLQPTTVVKEQIDTETYDTTKERLLLIVSIVLIVTGVVFVVIGILCCCCTPRDPHRYKEPKWSNDDYKSSE